MTSQPDEQTITIHMLLSISRIIYIYIYNKRNIYFKNHSEKETE